MKKIIVVISIFFIGLNFVSAKETIKYAACIDGDTFKVYIGNKIQKVRLLAVDAPELSKANKVADYYADEVSDYTCKRIKEAKKIVFEYDPNSDKQDKYDRVLAWVFLDDKLLQSDLVENGYAKVAYLYDDYKYTNDLIAKQELASAQNIGIWNKEAKNAYEESLTTTDSKNDDMYKNIEIAIISALFLLLVLISKKIFK